MKIVIGLVGIFVLAVLAAKRLVDANYIRGGPAGDCRGGTGLHATAGALAWRTSSPQRALALTCVFPGTSGTSLPASPRKDLSAVSAVSASADLVASRAPATIKATHAPNIDPSRRAIANIIRHLPSNVVAPALIDAQPQLRRDPPNWGCHFARRKFFARDFF